MIEAWISGSFIALLFMIGNTTVYPQVTKELLTFQYLADGFWDAVMTVVVVLYYLFALSFFVAIFQL